MDKGLLLVISAPSGGGKGTILKELFAQDENLRLSVSATTRGPRPGEEHGKQYYFLSREEFEGLIQEWSTPNMWATTTARPASPWRTGWTRATTWCWKSR